ncbi:hypothetical protein TB927.1.10 [Trypanosoma brucei brucei TREU927]|uniref:Uncharacterized protein n=1 Tax=Trypanosoma brucei brucei (strain 927/4 GUTat10.1) TaxID=185431 RepID=Q8IFJ5_TRYB2|nr:hypothetical protein TB927.1.10 [Trypanosoma brucei brucei TREU927]CAD53007.1 hypothetical protein TB927.1.10 [Trypanosoma brucei brucei TREU927]
MIAGFCSAVFLAYTVAVSPLLSLVLTPSLSSFILQVPLPMLTFDAASCAAPVIAPTGLVRHIGSVLRDTNLTLQDSNIISKWKRRNFERYTREKIINTYVANSIQSAGSQ